MVKKIYNIFYLTLVIICLLATGLPAQAAEKKIAIIPFKINAEKDLSFLQAGIVDMLSSRLSQPEEVAIVPQDRIQSALAGTPGSLNEAKARQVGTQVGADFVLFGSVTVFGSSISMDAKMVDLAGQKPTVSLYNQSQGMDSLITKVDQFAAQVNEEVFGRKVARPAAQAGTQASAQSAPSQTAQQTDPSRMHPEKLIQGGFGDTGSGFVFRQTGREGRNFWKSRSFKKFLTGIAVADVDNDGKQETVFTSDHGVYIYRLDNQKFFKVAELEEDGKAIVAVDIGDINGNGIPEIFVSALNTQYSSCNSMVLEFQGGQLKKIVDNAHTYYRVVQSPVGGDLLLGQRQRNMGDPAGSPIYQLIWDNGQYRRSERILPAKRANLLGTNRGEVLNNREVQTIAYDPSDRIQLFDAAGQKMWTAREQMGGNLLYVTKPRSEPGNLGDRGYLSLRLLITDLNGDDQNEVLAAKNHDATKRHLDRRVYTEAHIEAFSWDGIGLGSIWRTRKIGGVVSDFNVGDIDNDGEPELMATVIMKTGKMILTEAKSAIIAYDLGEVSQVANASGDQ